MLRQVLVASLFSMLALSGSGHADEAADKQKAIDAAQSFAISRVNSLPQGSVLKIRQVDFDNLGQAHIRLDHVYGNIPVFESEAIVHVDLKTGQQIGVTDSLKNFSSVAKIPGITALQARQQAAAHFKHTMPLGGRDDLMILVDERAVPYLAWRVHSEGADGRGPVDTIAFVNAQRGGVLRSWNNLHTGAAVGIKNGVGFFNGKVDLTTDKGTSSFMLRDPSRGNQYTCDMNNRTNSCSAMTDADNLWGTGSLSSRQTVAVDAQYGTAMTWDYYSKTFGRNGIANDSKGAYNRVHYGRNYANAFWSDACFCMTYGDGNGTTFNPFDSLDVAGHEMTHGVTSRTANLTYSGEPGGLNEATSDIFGTMVEYYANNSNDLGDYLIGEKLYKIAGKSLRNMQQPSTDGASSDCWYATLGNLNVHYSSGVANHFFFLLAEGAASTTYGSSKVCLSGDTRVANDSTSTLAGIGRDKAAAIWYRALTVYMTASTDYAGARVATLKAAADLYGAGNAEYDTVNAAWAAVKVN